MKKVILNLIMLLFCLNIFGQDISIKDFDQRGIKAINDFMTALNAGTKEEAAKNAIKFIHKSEYDNTGAALKQDRMNYSFKKAWENAKFYQTPVKVTRVQKQALTAIGFGNTAEKGTSYKVWISKKEGVAGLPAPLNVFFPADGSTPTLHYYGSL